MCIQFNINNNNDSDRKLLKENAKHFECEVFLKLFTISKEKVSVPIDPRIREAMDCIIIPQGQITPDYPLKPPTRDDKKEYRIGVVYFDEDGEIENFAPIVTFKYNRPTTSWEVVNRYRRGYHAMVMERIANTKQVLRNLYEIQATYQQYPMDLSPTKTTQVVIPVMLSDITAFDNSGQVAGRVMLIMSKEDYDTYNRDISSKPIVIKDKEVEVCLN
jgi:hypothetical protein